MVGLKKCINGIKEYIICYLQSKNQKNTIYTRFRTIYTLFTTNYTKMLFKIIILSTFGFLTLLK